MNGLDSDAAIWAAVDLELAEARAEDWDDPEALELQQRAAGLRTRATERPPSKGGKR